jgi:O-antigen ligase
MSAPDYSVARGMSEASLSHSAALSRGRLGSLAGTSGFAAVLAVVAVGGTGASSGGYFPTSWGWPALGLAWAAAIALLLRSEADAALLDVAFVGLLGLFAGWIWVSAVWSESPSNSVLEGERALVAVTGVAAGLLFASRKAVPQLLGGVAVAITAIAAYGLMTRLFPTHVGTFDSVAEYRLEAPLGYWNALGIFSTIGALLCFGFAARARTCLVRALAGAALAVLLPTLYFTFSRGSWIALGIGLGAAILLDPRRLQLLAALGLLAAVPALEVWLGSRRDALTHERADLSAAAHDGRRYALVVLAAALVTAGLAVVVAMLERRVTVGRVPPVAGGFAVAGGVIVALALIGARYGGPERIADRTWNSFKAPPAPSTGNLNERLFSFSGNGRVDIWTNAWRDHETHSVLGSGAGTYQEYWYSHRFSDYQVRDAHSLYLETLAELGPVGLALIVLALLVPVGGAVLARAHPLIPGAFGAYVAYVVHAGVDWDWEMTAVTLAALFVGIALVAGARGREPRPIRSWLRAVLVASAVAVAGLAFVVLVGNLKLARAHAAADRRDWASAAAHARSASDWAPWSAQALKALGEAQLHEGDDARAAARFREALSKDRQNADLWYDLHLATTGPPSDRAFARAVRLNPFGFDEVDRRAVLGRGTG